MALLPDHGLYGQIQKEVPGESGAVPKDERDQGKSQPKIWGIED